MMWQLVLEKVATLTELESSWSLDDALRVFSVCEFNKVQQDYLEKQNQKRD